MYIKSFVTANSSARKGEVFPIVSASDRDPFASDLGPSAFVSRTLLPRISFPRLRRAYPRPHALGVVHRRRARRPRTGQMLRRCLDSTRCWKRSFLWCCCVAPREICLGPSRCSQMFVVPEIFVVVLAVDSRVPLTLLDPHGLAFFGPCLPARSDWWLLEFR